jgi:hypothetical protein
MTDRERLEKMARENEERRAKEAADTKKKEEERNQAQAEIAAKEKQKTDELRAYCEATFKGCKLHPTGHEVSLGSATSSKLHRLGSDGGEYVTLLISHWSDETSNFQGSFPILMCRYKGGRYEYIAGVGAKKTHAGNLDDFKEVLLKEVAGIGAKELTPVFAAVRSMLGH